MSRTARLSILLILLTTATWSGLASDLEVEVSILHMEVEDGAARGMMRVQVVNRSDRSLEEIILSLAAPGEDQIEGTPFQVAQLGSGQTADVITSFSLGASSVEDLSGLLWQVSYQDGGNAKIALLATRQTPAQEVQ